MGMIPWVMFPGGCSAVNRVWLACELSMNTSVTRSFAMSLSGGKESKADGERSP
jgi:hypothetical protein